MNDPLCDTLFQQLSTNLPYATHIHSKLVCRITGQLMDDRNPPMVLPNGNVYSLKGVESISKEGVLTDPRTNEQFPVTALKKGFIMN